MAESSITIEGVGAVIDSGLARVAGHSPWSGLPTLHVARISQASANQRAGRAGRTGPGCAIRLYPLEDFVRRPAHDTPEIARADLAPAALLLEAMGAGGFDALEWLDRAACRRHRTGSRPSAPARRFRAGWRAKWRAIPLHPRLARLMVEARRRGVAEDGCTVAALLSAGERLPAGGGQPARSDLLALMEAPWDPRTAQIVRQIRRMADPPRQRGHDEDALLISVLAAFPDRVARRRQGRELQLASGGPAQLAPSSTVTGCEFLVAVEAEERRDQKAPLVRLASGIRPEWLLDLFPERVREIESLEWNRAAERVEAVSALMFDQIAIQESRGVPGSPAAARAPGIEGRGSRPGAFRLARRSGRVPRARQLSPRRTGRCRCPRRTPFRGRWHRLPKGCAASRNSKPPRAGGGLLRALERQLTPGERQAARRDRAGAHPPAPRPPGEGALRTRPAALDRLAPAGFLRHARNPRGGARRGPAGGATARAQPSAGAGDERPGRLLAAPLPASPQRAGAPLSQARLAGKAGVSTNLHSALRVR